MKDLYIIKNRLNEALKMRDMTPQQLADRSGLYFTSIYRYLHGDRIPKTDSIEKMATALNVSPSWLIGYDVPITPDFTTKYTEQDKELTLLIEKLKPEDKEAVKVIIKAILSKEEAENDKPEI